MKRVIFASIATLLALYMLLTYRPVASQTLRSPTPMTITQSDGTSSSTTPASIGPSGTSLSTKPGVPTTLSPQSSFATRPNSTTSSSVNKPVTTSPVTTAPSADVAKTVNGSVANTRYGPVQVAISVKGGRIIGVSALQYPQSNSHDVAINSEAIPILQRETLQAQSARIATVSGATYTSEGWITSLQAALNAAGM